MTRKVVRDQVSRIKPTTKCRSRGQCDVFAFLQDPATYERTEPVIGDDRKREKRTASR